MKKTILIIITLTMVFLAGCNSNTNQPAQVITTMESNPAVEESTSSTPEIERVELNLNFENALSTRLLLALGTLRLDDTITPITSEQAPQMLLLWQALDYLTNSGTGAQEEVDALFLQIESTLTSDQIKMINEMKLTQSELQIWAQNNGITNGSGGSGTGQGQGQGGGMSAEARATRQAENGDTNPSSNGENGLSASITKMLIDYLSNIK